MASLKLNIFQRGILQKCATVFVYMASVTCGAFLLDWLDKLLFIRLAEEAQRQNLLSQNGLRGFTTLIEARDSTITIAIILLGVRFRGMALHALGSKAELVMADNAAEGCGVPVSNGTAWHC